MHIFSALCSHAMLSSSNNHWNIFSSTNTVAAWKIQTHLCIYPTKLLWRRCTSKVQKANSVQREKDSERKKEKKNNHRVLLVNLKGSLYPIFSSSSHFSPFSISFLLNIRCIFIFCAFRRLSFLHSFPCALCIWYITSHILSVRT